ncbi:MAG: type III-A CRISPR-associated RAMP protein Csm3 [Planctomycetia bacterium]|uniref:type III-A CRISPR-associated RAMP protein Csm3 n=1 Tax=Candidatus Kuenenia sp. TaxID=2499824 RepID=UPI001D99C5D5|nr:type III-A CRISPR-associated RAMP protein Csm3 [Planctomycetia bacterium]MCL4743607.1 type III-A CRISPR-associated RAMP protein Csm3 [Phycisphaerales bacterium]
MSNNEYKFNGKYIIKADLRCLTGLHIGGTEEGFEIGGMDNPVIRDPITGYPYIPGSSLKGKMRSLLEWSYDKVKIETNNKTKKLNAPPCACGSCDICAIFGSTVDTKGQKEPTRLTVRDSYPKGLLDTKGRTLPEEQRKGTIAAWQTNLGENIFTEVKTENAIDRLTSEANSRSLERVPVDSVFEVEILFDLYKDTDKNKLKSVFEAMEILEDSALGGGGSRGSGKVAFENITIQERSVNYYLKGDSETKINLNGHKSAREISKNFNIIFNVETVR